jgi:rhodanese-related sulfurtransferase
MWYKLIIYGLAVIFTGTLSECNTQIKKQEKMNTETKQAIKEIIVDVRSSEEWEYDGHADCSVNYPLDIFEGKIPELKKYDRVVIVCRSGNRAEFAKKQLLNACYTKEVENLGPWQNVRCDN